MTRFWMLLCWTAVCAIPLSLFADIEFDFNDRHEVQANTFTKSAQAAAAITNRPDGGFTVVWHSRRQQQGTYGIYAQQFAADGKAIGEERQINLHTHSMQMNPAIAIDKQGGTWVAWESFGQDGSFNGIIARRFDSEGFVGSDEFLINQFTEGNQSQIVLAATSEETMTFLWVTQNRSGTKKHIAARSFDLSGQPRGDEYMLADSNRHQSSPGIASCGSGCFVSVWAEQNAYGKPAGIFTRIVDVNQPDSHPVVPLGNDDNVPRIEPVISQDSSGSFALSWLSAVDDQYQVMFQIFDSQGQPLKDAVRVSIPSAVNVSGAAIESLGDEQYLVAWNQQTDSVGKDCNILGQLFHREQRLGSIFPVNANQTGKHQMTIASGKQRMAWDRRAKQLRVAWSGQNENDDSSVNVTALIGESAKFAFVAPEANRSTATFEDSAKPHEPPVYDPKTVAKEPFGGFIPGPEGGGTDFGFVAINSTGWNPPDPEMGVGPNHIVAMTNGAIAFFDKAGNLTFSDEIEDSNGFWGQQGATGFVFDPEVLFDPHSQRFFAMANERGNNRSYFLLAVSDDDNPNGNWNKYRFDVTDLADNNIDSPNMAVDDEVIYLTADFFGPDRYLVYMIRKSDVLVGDPTPLSTNLLITGSQSFGLPLIYDANAPAFYMLQAFEFGTFSSLRMHAITNPLTNPTRETTDVTVPSYGHPQDPPQQGTSSRPELFEARFWSCVYRNGSLWAVHHHSPNPNSLARVRWYEFNMNGWPTSGQTPALVQSGELTPNNNGGQPSATFFPSIWVDETGNAAITMAQSSSTEFISMARAVRSASDTLGTFQDVQIVQPSTTAFSGGRWGDYSATNSDPVQPDTFWGIHEFAQSNGVWQTYVARYEVGVGNFSIFPNSAFAENGTVVAGGFPELRESDDQYFAVQAEPPNKQNSSAVVAVFGANTINTEFNELTLVVESSVNSSYLTQTVELFNFFAGEFELLDSRVLDVNDATLELVATGDVSRFVTPGSGSLLARIRMESSGPTLFFPWRVNIDRVEWQLSD